MSQIIGTVTMFEGNVSQYQTKFGTMHKNKITVQDEDGNTVTIEKGSKPTTNFNLKEGTRVQIKYDSTEYGNKVQSGMDALVILDQQSKNQSVTGSSSSSALSTSKSSFDPNGARNGMLLKAGLDLAALRFGKTATEAQIMSSVAEMGRIAGALEGGTLNDSTKIKSSSTATTETLKGGDSKAKERPKQTTQEAAFDEDMPWEDEESEG